MEFDKIFVGNYLSREKYSSGPLAALSVIALCFICSIFYWDSSLAISSKLAANPENVFMGQEYYRLFTSTFVHGGMEHLLSNSLMLFVLTYFVTSFFGLWISPLLSFFMGAIINLIVLLSFEHNITLVGASGVVYYLWGFWLVLFLIIERQTSLVRRLVKVFGIFLILLVPTSYAPTTSYLAHYVGFILGVISGLTLYPVWAKKIRAAEEWKLVPVPELEPADEVTQSP